MRWRAFVVGHPERVRYCFTIRYVRAMLVTFFGFIALVEIPGIFDPGKGGLGGRIFAAAIVCGGIALTIRSARCATVLARDAGFEYRSLLRTRRWAWPELEPFEAADAAVGVMAWRRRVLFARTADGTLRKLEEINARAARSPNPIDGVVENLNACRAAALGLDS